MSGAGRDDKDQLWSEATLWFARMRSPDAEAFRAQFEEWLARGALHRRYYNRASEHWMQSTAAYRKEPSRARASGQAPPALTRPAGHGRGAIAAAIAGCVLIASSTMLIVAHHRGEQGRAGPGAAQTGAASALLQFATAAGEQQGVRLADGSVVMLASETVLKVQLGTAIRRLELDRGAARFDVAHEARPFVVFAGGGAITAHGTVFDVRVTPERSVSVRLVRGSVDVRFPAAAQPQVQPPTRRLHPGETVSFAAAPVTKAADQPNAPPAEAQAEGARDYRDVRLADLVSEANRHAAVPIRFTDPAIGAKTISGRFRTDDTSVLAERLAALFDLSVEHSSSGQILLRPK